MAIVCIPFSASEAISDRSQVQLTIVVAVALIFLVATRFLVSLESPLSLSSFAASPQGRGHPRAPLPDLAVVEAVQIASGAAAVVLIVLLRLLQHVA